MSDVNQSYPVIADRPENDDDVVEVHEAELIDEPSTAEDEIVVEDAVVVDEEPEPTDITAGFTVNADPDAALGDVPKTEFDDEAADQIAAEEIAAEQIAADEIAAGSVIGYAAEAPVEAEPAPEQAAAPVHTPEATRAPEGPIVSLPL